MPAFRSYFKLAKVICGVTTGGVITAAVVVRNSQTAGGPDQQNHCNNLMPTVLASWTTNFTPSVQWDDNWDRRNPESLLHPSRSKSDSTDGTTDDVKAKLQKLKPVANRHILMIRHGNYDVNAETDELRILSPLGREQAELTGLRLKELSFPYTVMVNSSMARAIETADIIAKSLPDDLPREQCDMLREGAPIPPEPPIGHWKPEMRQFFEDGARIEAAFRKYFHRADPEQAKDSYEILTCHANVIRYFVCRALQIPPEAWLRISLHHGSITWVTIRPSGRVTLRTLGDSGHMPPAKITSS